MIWLIVGLVLATIFVKNWTNPVEENLAANVRFYRNPIQLHTASTAVDNTHVLNPSVSEAENPYIF